MDFKTKRKELKLTQSDVAKKVGVSLTAYQCWERGVMKPKGENKKNVYKLFGFIDDEKGLKKG